MHYSILTPELPNGHACRGGCGGRLHGLRSEVEEPDGDNQAGEQGSPVTDTELVDLLANLHIIPGECTYEAAVEAAQVWATVEDYENVVEAMRLDAVDEMTAQLEGTGVGGLDFTDDEKEDGDDERTGRGGTVPPYYAEISSSLGLLEREAEEGGHP